MNASATDQRIRSLRPPKPYVDPFAAHGSLIDALIPLDPVAAVTATVALAAAQEPAGTVGSHAKETPRVNGDGAAVPVPT